MQLFNIETQLKASIINFKKKKRNKLYIYFITLKQQEHIKKNTSENRNAGGFAFGLRGCQLKNWRKHEAFRKREMKEVLIICVL